MAYDIDGSAGFVNVGSLRSLTAGEMTTLNSETGVAVSRTGDNLTSYIGVVFPQLRDIVGVNHGLSFAGNTTGQSKAFQTSVDTTNGSDGVWVTQTASMVLSTNYRTGITTYSLTNIKGVRWNVVTGQSFAGVNFGQFHVYGTIASGLTPDRLRLWHPTLDQELAGAYFDYGDQVRGAGPLDKTFRVKNNSSTLQANNVVLAVSALTDTTPTVVGQMTLSQGGAFASTQTITSIAAGAISAVCTLRYSVSASASLSVWRQRVTATPSSWS